MRELSSLDGGTSRKTTAQPGPKPGLKNKNKADLRPLYAFLAALGLYIVAMLLYKKDPLGDNSFLLSDLTYLYYQE